MPDHSYPDADTIVIDMVRKFAQERLGPNAAAREKAGAIDPSLFGGSSRNPSGEILGIDVEDSVGTMVGAMGTAWGASLLQQHAGSLFGAAGKFSGSAQAIAAAVGAHYLVNRFARRWARMVGPGINLAATVAVANDVAPGLVPITIGVPKQLANFPVFTATQPTSNAALAAATTGVAALPPAPGSGAAMSAPSVVAATTGYQTPSGL